MKLNNLSRLTALLLALTIFMTSVAFADSVAVSDYTADDYASQLQAAYIAAYAYDGTADVGKYAKFAESEGVIFVYDNDPDFSDDPYSFAYEDFLEDTIVCITDWAWMSSTSALLYKVEFYRGGVIEEASEYWPAEAWVLQCYTDSNEFASLEFVTICEDCGEPDCNINHDAPDTEAVIPEKPTLTEGEAVSLVDANGEPITNGEILRIKEGTKYSLSAWTGLEDNGDETYQWQISAEETGGVWVNISGQTSKGLLTSLAMFEAAFKTVPYIRCKITTGGQTLYSQAIPVAALAEATLTDSNSDVSVAGLLPLDATLNVTSTSLEETGLDNGAYPVGEASLFSDVTLYRAGSTYQPEEDEKVTVTFSEASVTEAGLSAGDGYHIYHIHDGAVDISGVQQYNGGDIAMTFGSLSVVGISDATQAGQSLVAEHGEMTPGYFDGYKVGTFNSDSVVLYETPNETDYLWMTTIDGYSGAEVEFDTYYTYKDGFVIYEIQATNNTPEELRTTLEHYCYVSAADITISGETEEPEVINTCAICGTENCTKQHLYCEEHSKFDCTENHEKAEPTKPLTEAVIPENLTFTPNADVCIADAKGNKVTSSFELPAGTQASLSAWPAGDAYQWQIKDKDGNWMDIRGKDQRGLLFSGALFADANAQPVIRCEVTVGGEVKHSAEIRVNVTTPAAEASLLSVARAADPVVTAEGDNLDKYTVEIKYVFENNEVVASSHAASLAAGTSYSVTVANPTIKGYKPTQGTGEAWGDTVVFAEDKVTINIPDIQDHVTVTVVYQPTNVEYTVIHYWQNIDNDNYSIKETETKVGLTKSIVSDVAKAYPGMYALLYEKPEIAADGSTVVEVYYDRNYYLMLFDLGEGGYGVEPIYARYDAPVTVGTPTRPGYTFNGWSPAVPTTVPVGGGTYTAQWTAQDTEYARVYWVVNENGTKTYIGSEIISAQSGSVVSGGDTLTIATNVCGMAEHTHDDTCVKICTLPDHVHGDGNCVYACGKSEHDHTSGCYCALDVHEATEHTRDCYTFTAATVSTSSTQVNNATHVRSNNGLEIYRNGQYGQNYYVKINGSYYRIYYYSNNTSLAYQMTCHYHTSACCTIEAHEHNADCCNLHAHDAACYSCGSVEHTHVVGCKTDLAKYVQFVDADQNVTVEGDGSSIVNVNYEYKTYTIRFIYARQNGGSYQIATLTRDGRLTNCDWNGSGSTTLPTFKDPSGKTERSTVQIGNYTYYYISLTAKYGADISSIWPSGNMGNAGNYQWGSWAAEYGTGYRVKYGDAHANIVGPYPIMSADMIVDNPTKLEDGTYLAQNMIAWWGNRQGIALHAYHNYFELLPGEEEVEGQTYREHGGKTYKLVQTYTFTAAHNGSTRVDPIYFNGYHCVNDSRDTNDDTQANSNNFANNGNCAICGDECNYCNDFFYDRNVHKLYFWNHNGYLQGSTGTDVVYGEALTEYGDDVSKEFMAQPENYPVGLEANAYQFAGWYTTAECLDGTEVDWNATMPDSDMTLYAKWVPVTRTVTFCFEQASDTPICTVTVPHGSKIAEDDVPNNLDNGDYEFIGWFYMEDGVEKAFDFDNMQVTKDLQVYAKWSSNVLKEYTVYFKYDDGSVNADGSKKGVEIADPITGSAKAGLTKTFDAKGGEELYPLYQEGYFPLVKSHSMTLNIEHNHNEGDNTFTFWYVKKDAVPYKVYYVAETLKEGEPTEGKATITRDGKTYYIIAETYTNNGNRKAVVTENFEVVTGYMPDAYQKRLVVTTGGVDSDNDGVADQNEIIFYYKVDTEHAYYKITHYTQNTDGENWTEYKSSQAPGDIGQTYTAEQLTIDGFTYARREYLVGQKEVGADHKLTADGLQINLYYTRNSYPYEVRYLEQGTGKPLANPKTGTGLYGKVISESPIGIPGYTAVDPTSQTLVIKIEESQDAAKLNIITFYYTENEVTINYEPVGPKDATNFGSVDPTSETLKVLNGTAQGSTATATEYYQFVGWYTDAECTTAVTESDGTIDSSKFTPAKSGDLWTEKTYYAKFVEKTATINYVAVGPEDATDFGSVAPENETVNVLTGVAQGSTATAGTGYTFVGWFDKEDCTGEAISTNPNYVPTKPEGTAWIDGTTYYAKFVEKETTITYQAAYRDGVEIKLGATGGTVDVEANGVDASAQDSETVLVVTGAATGAKAIANAPTYKFVGWYSDKACTQQVGDTEKYVPTKEDGAVWPNEPIYYYALFELDVADLTITKQVTAAADGSTAPVETFTVKVTLTKADGPYTYTSNQVAGGTLNLTDGVGTLSIVAGETITIKDIVIGTDYMVEEINVPSYFQASDATDGKIGASENAVNITNTYLTGSLTITKEVVGDTTNVVPDDAFEFMLNLSEKQKKYSFTKTEATESTSGEVAHNGKVTLKHGESITITGIPLGTDFTVTETANSNYTQSPDKVQGKIGTDSKAEFTNTYLRGDLQITKKVSGDKAPSGSEFTFTIELTGKELDGTEINGEYGNVTFTNGTATVKLQKDGSITIKGLPGGIDYKITEAATLGYTPNKSIAEGKITAGAVHVESFTNDYKTGGLTVSKTVEGDTAPDATFTFTLGLRYNGSDITPAIKLNGTEVDWKGSTSYTFSVPKNGSVNFSDIPDGATYTVAEVTSADFAYTTTVAVNGANATDATTATGTLNVATRPTEEVAFTNTYTNGDLQITKQVVNDTGFTPTVSEFVIQVELTGTNLNTAGYTVEDLATGKEVTWSGSATKLTAKIPVTATLGTPATVTIKHLPAGTTYTVTESAPVGFTASIATTADNTNTTNKIDAGKMDSVTVTNTYKVGSLEVTKEVDGGDAPVGEKFTFTLTLSDTVTTVKCAIGDGAATDLQSGNTFELEKGQKALITGIPAGVEYTVTETENPDYTTKVGETETNTATGTIVADSTSEIKFTNTYKYSHLTIKKTGMKSNTESAIFTVSNGEKTFTVVVPNEDSVTIGKLLIGDTYTVTESGSWTWLYTPSISPSSVKITEGGNTVTVTNSGTDKWLHDESGVINNLGTGSKTPIN